MSGISNFAKAFIEAQKEMGTAIKDNKNPFFKSNYADLNSIREACLPALNKHGIAVLQPIVQVEGKNFVKTLLLHESGESMEGLTEIIFAKQNDAQAQGSGITYARRYGLQSLVNVGAEDDDGNKASEPKSPHKRLDGIADDEQMETLRRQKKMDDLAAKREKAIEFTASLKEKIADCETATEIEAIERENAAAIKKLESYTELAAELKEFLIEAKNEASYVS